MTDPRARRRLRRRPLGGYRYVRLRWRLLFAAVDLAGGLVFSAARAVRRRLRRAKATDGHGGDDPRVILLVQLDHMGDAIISTAMLGALRARYPEASIEVLSGAWNRELFEAVPEIDCVHVSRVNRFSRCGRLGWMAATIWWGLRLRRRKVDLAIDVRGEFPLALILWLSGARRRVGWDCGGGGFLLTDSPSFVPDRPEVDSRAALLGELGIRSDGPTEQLQPVFRPTEEARRRVRRRLAAQLGDDSAGRPRLVLHVGAGTPAKQWPPRHWQELIGRLIVDLDAQLVLVGGPGDRIITREILGRQPWPQVVDWTGTVGIVELAALLERADVFVGCDSGPAHLAAAVGTPEVVLFSGTNNPAQWQPRGPDVTILRHPVECSPCHRRHCPLADHPCMEGLPAEAVARAVCQSYRKYKAATAGRAIVQNRVTEFAKPRRKGVRR